MQSRDGGSVHSVHVKLLPNPILSYPLSVPHTTWPPLLPKYFANAQKEYRSPLIANQNALPRDAYSSDSLRLPQA
jgi:hypothetical protein